MMRRVSGDRRGIAAIEFAIVAPLLIILALATVDLVQFIRSQLRLDETAAQLGQLVSQCEASAREIYSNSGRTRSRSSAAWDR
jgi:Flp pilus assembly protein TadG